MKLYALRNDKPDTGGNPHSKAMLKILTKREIMILYAAIGVIIFAIGFNFLISPTLTRNNYLNKELNLTRAKLKKYLWLLSQKDNIQAKFSKFSFAPKVAGQQEEITVSALSELERLAKNANIRIIDIRPRSISKGPDLYAEVLIDLRAEGEMEGYLKFIYDLENSLLLLRIKRFQLAAKPNTPNLLEGNFSISKLSGRE